MEFDSKGQKIKAITSASTLLVNKKKVCLNLSKGALLLSSLFHNITYSVVEGWTYTAQAQISAPDFWMK